MVMRNQQTLPLRDSTRHNDGRPVAVVTRATGKSPVRWGAAVVDPSEGRQVLAWKDLKEAGRRGRRARVTGDGSLSKLVGKQLPARPRAAGASAVAEAGTDPSGGTFARNRIQRGLDLFGACMMIVTFLAFAMFA